MIPPRVDWARFRAEYFDWRQGAHLTTVAPNGWGKTSLVQSLLEPDTRPGRYTAVLSTKKRDPIVDDYKRLGYNVRTEWDIPDADLAPNVVIAPKIGGFNSIAKQRDVFHNALDAIYRQGGWTVVLDELRILSDSLGLKQEIETLLSQGRSHGVTVVCGAQRPRHVPLLAFDQPRHLFFGHDNDISNARRYGEIGGGPNPRELHDAIAALEKHEWLYVDTEPPGQLLRVKPEL